MSAQTAASTRTAVLALMAALTRMEAALAQKAAGPVTKQMVANNTATVTSAAITPDSPPRGQMREI
jgi:hypothetical protein